MEFGTLVLLVLGYPFLAAWLVGLKRGDRIASLEEEIARLRERFEASLPAPPQSSIPAPEEYGKAWALPDPAADEALWRREWDTEPQKDTPAEPAAHVEEFIPPAVLVAKEQADDQAADPRPEREVAQTVIGATRFDLDAAPVHNSANIPADLGAAPPDTPASPGWAGVAWNWLFTGNLVAKLGLVILFIGVGFLLKYVAETVYISIEVRLAGVVLATIALLGWGGHLRTARRELALPVQGTAIAILMLVVFGAHGRYGIVPLEFAFALLVTLTAFTCLLAILQESPWLAAFGIAGGFASPVLLSTGGGNHVFLFSYYALLNASVFVLAIKRAWRPLNLIGFAFTFIVGTAWGVLRYTEANYPSAQFFLGLFFLFYVGIALADARQQQARLKHYVDAILVLGTPLLAFGLQAGLVQDKPFGLALSTLALGGFYLGLAVLLWRRGRERWRMLAESFLAFGVIFGTLAIPFAVDGRWTSGVWALEGAGFVWFGLRRQQHLTWMFGVLLQTGAWMGFIGAATGLDPEAARTSNLWLGFLLLAGSAFAVARGFRQHTGDDSPALSHIAIICLVIAAGWLLAGTWVEAILHTRGSLLANLLATGALLTAGLLYLSGARLAWPLARRLAFAAQVAGAFALVAVSAVDWRWIGMKGDDDSPPLAGALMIALAALVTSFLIRRSPDPEADRRFSTVFVLWGGAWWFGPGLIIASSQLDVFAPAVLGTRDARWIVTYALLSAASTIAFSRLASRLAWPQLRWLAVVSWGLLALFTAALLAELYGTRILPDPGVWLAWALFWGSSEYVLLRRTQQEVPLHGLVLRFVHVVRTAGPWLALWPTGAILIGEWLEGPLTPLDAADQAGWALSSAWGNYLPTWAMMLVLAWLLRRSRAGGWPTVPLAQWYRRVLVPCGALFVLALAAAWNTIQDGAMAPLPYLPLLNPLDLTTGFALFLCLQAARALVEGHEGQGTLMRRLPTTGVAVAYVWFNLILLRSAAQYRPIPYRLEELVASQFVQAMLSLVWCASALVLMRFAARRALRASWSVGAALIGVVVLKLFTFDLANSGSLARVVSFVGVGLLMVLIGYFAPFPKTAKGHTLASQGA